MTNPDEIDQLWDYDQPAESERRFRDGFVPEELGECLWALGRAEEARPFFAQAHAELSQDQWLVEGEPARLARLKALGEGQPAA